MAAGHSCCVSGLEHELFIGWLMQGVDDGRHQRYGHTLRRQKAANGSRHSLQRSMLTPRRRPQVNAASALQRQSCSFAA